MPETSPSPLTVATIALVAATALVAVALAGWLRWSKPPGFTVVRAARCGGLPLLAAAAACEAVALVAYLWD